MRKTTKFILAILFVLGIQTSFAQKQIVKGKITDASTGLPLRGASVKLKSTTSGSTTDENGNFSLEVTPNSTLLISIIGYADQTVKVGSRTSIEIKMQTAVTDLTQVTMVGTRTAGRIKTESPVPIDVIKINQAGQTTARMDLTSALNYAAPSFNYNKQSGADGADHVDLGTLRGLGPDQTLVLINGKRRHQTAFVALFGTRGRGNSGTDMNAFPEGAVDRIEILRDGASAQYGSDAMAGVINIILKKDINHWTINTGWSGYDDGKFNSLKSSNANEYYTGHQIDGGTATLSINNGFAIGKNGGYVNITADFLTQAKTLRQVQDTNVISNSKALPLNTGRRAFGDGSVTTGGIMYNMEIPGSGAGKTTFYSFGGYNYKASDAYAYTRNWAAKPDRFPHDLEGNILYVPSIMHVSPTDTFYNPHIQTHIRDLSFAAGVKGKMANDWTWDLSNTIGQNDFHYFGDKTFNASHTGDVNQTHFDDGGFNFLQNTVNLDFSKSFKSVGQGLNLGFGAEYRYERYSIYKGETASYDAKDTAGVYFHSVGEVRSPAPGSQGFPGFSPNDEVTASRSNVGVYVDAELNATKDWLVDGALRFENYSDFGSVFTYKFATRYKVAPGFNLRGSISTGFRAPSLQQINFSNTLTSFQGGQLVQSRIARNGSDLANAAGIPKLKQENSFNASVGFSWKPIAGLTFTADGYLVQVKNRVVLSGLFDGSLSPSFAAQLNALNVSTAQFFDNAVNTTNYGLDIVADYTKRFGNQTLKILLAGNIQSINIDAVHVPALLNDSYIHQKTFFSTREEAFLKATAPKEKITLGLEYSFTKLGFGAHLTYFGKVMLTGFGLDGTGINPMVPTDTDPNTLVPENFNYNGKVTTDVFVSYKLCKNATLYFGADNLFNVHPDLGVNPAARYWAGDNESGGPWDSVQMGFNGMRLFGKLSLNF